MTRPVILHVIDLFTVGGVQVSAVNTVTSTWFQSRFDSVVLQTAPYRTQPHYRESLENAGVPLIDPANRGNAAPVARFPLMVSLARHILRMRPAILLLWSTLPTRGLIAICRLANTRVVFWDRGVSSLRAPSRRSARALARVDALLCNAQATRRLLQLRWGVTRPITVCLNAVRTDLFDVTVQPKRLAASRPLRIGFAGRLIPLKGAGLVIAALAELQRRSRPAELVFAGYGYEEPALADLAGQLGVTALVRFLGPLSDMRPFYRDIDILVCPSLREPFGLVSVEAQAFGCPVVVSAVDGLPETVQHGRTGIVVEPTLDRSAYARYAGSLDGIPEQVYHPTEDALGPPRAADPVHLADAICLLIDSPERYHTMSEAAIAHAREHFTFQRHVETAIGVLEGVLEPGEAS